MVKSHTSKVTTFILNDHRHPKIGASVLTLSGKSNVLSNITQDYGGMNSGGVLRYLPCTVGRVTVGRVDPVSTVFIFPGFWRV